MVRSCWVWSRRAGCRELADQITAELPGQLGNRLGDVNWQLRVAGAERADTTPTGEELKQAVRRRMQDEGWDLAVALTDLPLRANRRPVTAHASAMYRVGTPVRSRARRALGLAARDAGRAQPGGGVARRGRRPPQRRRRDGPRTSDAPAPRGASVAARSRPRGRGRHDRLRRRDAAGQPAAARRHGPREPA